MVPWKEKLRALRSGIGTKNLCLLLLAAGLLLLSFAGNGGREQKEEVENTREEVPKEVEVSVTKELEERLEELLLQIKGVGEAKVMI
ncbi:MAG: hypothetical protein K2O03_02725, partial [Lachnospiraceae bacterium]|nr:hypothetical protein [Lachnospiraceae bacterium]